MKLFRPIKPLLVVLLILGCNYNPKKVYIAKFVNFNLTSINNPKFWQEANFDSSFYLINRPDYWDGKTDVSAKFKAQWDSTSLFLLIDITDDILFTQSYPVSDYDKPYWRGWDYDCIELYFQLKKSPKTYRHYIFTYSVDTITAGYNYQHNNIQFNFEDNKNGYSFIAEIPWSDIDFDVTQMDQLLFEIQIGDNDKRFISDSLTYGGMENVIMWANSLPEDYRFFHVERRDKIYGKIELQ